MRRFFLLSLVSLIQFMLLSQTDDFETWTDIGLRKKINKNLSLNFEESIRLFQNSGNVKSFNTDIGFEYNLNKTIEMKFTYRLTFRKRVNGYFLKNRGNTDIILKKTYNQVKVSFRNRIQLEKDGYINEQSDLYPSLENRNRLKILYNIRGIKNDPFISMEIFHYLNRWRFYDVFETRCQAGFARAMPNNIKLSMGVIYKRERNRTVENILIFNLALRKSL